MMNNYLQLIYQIFSFERLKMLSFTAISTLVRFLVGFVSLKYFAVFIGPEGLALIGNLNNFIVILSAFASLGISNGIIKYVSEYKNDIIKFQRFISTGFKVSLYASILLSLSLLVLSHFFSKKILLSVDYTFIFIFLAVGLPAIVINTFLVSILNGLKEYRKLAILNILNSFVIISLISFLVLSYHLKGALFSIVFSQLLVLFCTLFIIRNENWFTKDHFFSNINLTFIKGLSNYSLMAISSAILVPTSQFYLRNTIVAKMSITDAGEWEALNRLSTSYLSLILTTFSVYYLPILVEIKEKKALLNEIKQFALLILPIVGILQIVLFLFKHQMILLLFSKDFKNIEALVGWQLLGDFLKVTAFLFGYIIVAKAMTKTYVFLEIISTASYIILSIFLLNQNGLIGMIQAYVINYVFFLVILLSRFFIYFKSEA